ncbi:MAG: translational GTPase TypA [Candidatus Methylacidiphilales bacterium]
MSTSTAALPVREDLRNLAIIAHIDHGKTTLVDQLLKQSGTFRENQATEDRMMDSMDLEKEKGITIRAKNASIHWKGVQINIVDTPGHADFGGEVERIMKMIDGCILIVDAFEGAQAQTKFVLRKALENGLKPIVLINKIDRENARPNQVLDMTFDLFCDLNASDEQLDFPVIYASARDGYATAQWDGVLTDEIKAMNMDALFDAMVKHVPPPTADLSGHFQMLVANLDYSDYVGRIAFGKIYSGSIAVGNSFTCLHGDGSHQTAKVTKIFSYEGMKQIELEKAEAGMIVGLSGIEEVYIGETLTDLPTRPALPFMAIDPPTIQMQILVNDSPLAGREGKFLTARHIKDRLVKETRTSVGLTVEETETAGAFRVSARGEMQIAVIVEQMRREGFELMVSRPEVILKRGENGEKLEPYETVYVEVPNDRLGDVIQNLAERKAETQDMKHQSSTVLVEAVVPTRGLIGFETDLLNLTKGEGIMSHIFKEYGPWKGEIKSRANGVVVSMENGETTAYALDALQARAILFIGPGEQVYDGMIVGQNSRPDDMTANPCKAKALTNMRSQGDGKGIQLSPPLNLSLERMLEYVSDDEYVEITPGKLRLRKKILDANLRKRSEKKAQA